MKKISAAIAFVALGAILSGCASVQSTVTVFHTLPPMANGDTVTILAADQAQFGTLEFRAFATHLASYLEADGYRIVPISDHPKYAAFFGYGIDNGTLVTRAYSIPQYGVTGYSGSTTTGTINTFGNVGTVQATTTYTPMYGVTGYQSGTEVDRVFRRVVTLDIFDATRLRPNDVNSFPEAQVYSGRLSSDGSCAAICRRDGAIACGSRERFPRRERQSTYGQAPL